MPIAYSDSASDSYAMHAYASNRTLVRKAGSGHIIHVGM